MMKKKMISGLMLTLFSAGILLPGCNDASKESTHDQKKIENAKEEVKEAEKDLQQAKQEANQTIQQANESDQMAKQTDDWKSFRADAIAKIHNNEVRIADLRDKKKSSGKSMDKVYSRKIDKLEERNNELRKDIEQYQEKPSNWESFKAEWNHDMDELGNAFKDLVTDNTK